ncbi:MAG TPA: type II toxin-antitoxin system VapC family toxin [Solirubrobacteraceae bacterium]
MGDVALAPVLDSDVLIDYLRGAGPGRDLLRNLHQTLAYRVTAVSAFELSVGHGRGQRHETEDALLAVPCLALTREAAIRAGSVLRELRARGAGIEARDAMQAGICLVADAPLVTRNVRHFSRVPGLVVVEPGQWL